MKSEKFIREFGVEKAREVVEGAPKGATHYDIPFEVYLRSTEFWNGSEWKAVDNLTIQNLELPPFVDFPDLKRLVESLDEIESYGGIELFKEHVNGVALMLCGIRIHPEVKRLDRILKDHESIYGGGENA